MNEVFDKEIMLHLIEHARAQVAHSPYAACIINDNGEILSYSIGEPIDNPILHAEISAIFECSKTHPEANWSTLSMYTTAEPCIMCASACCWAGFKRVVYGTDIPFIRKLWGVEATMRAAEVFAAMSQSPALIANIEQVATNQLFLDKKELFLKDLQRRKLRGFGQMGKVPFPKETVE